MMKAFIPMWRRSKTHAKRFTRVRQFVCVYANQHDARIRLVRLLRGPSEQTPVLYVSEVPDDFVLRESMELGIIFDATKEPSFDHVVVDRIFPTKREMLIAHAEALVLYGGVPADDGLYVGEDLEWKAKTLEQATFGAPLEEGTIHLTMTVVDGGVDFAGKVYPSTQRAWKRQK